MIKPQKGERKEQKAKKVAKRRRKLLRLHSQYKMRWVLMLEI